MVEKKLVLPSYLNNTNSRLCIASIECRRDKHWPVREAFLACGRDSSSMELELELELDQEQGAVKRAATRAER